VAYLSTLEGRNELRNYKKQGLYLTHKKELFSAPVEVISSVAKAFPEGFKMPCSENGDKFALHIALENEDVSKNVIEEMFNLKVAFPALEDSDGRIPLHIACISNLTRSHEILILLLEKYKSGASKRDKSHFLPIHYAVQNNTVTLETIKFILNAHPQVLAVNKRELKMHCYSFTAFAYCSLISHVCWVSNRHDLYDLVAFLLQKFPQAIQEGMQIYLPLVVFSNYVQTKDFHKVEPIFLLLANSYPDGLKHFGPDLSLPFTRLLESVGNNTEISEETWKQVVKIRPEVICESRTDTPLSLVLARSYFENQEWTESSIYALKYTYQSLFDYLCTPRITNRVPIYTNPLHQMCYCAPLLNVYDFAMMLRKIAALNSDSFFSRDGIGGNQPLHILCKTIHASYTQYLSYPKHWPVVRRMRIENDVLNDFDLSTPIQAFLLILPNRNISSKLVLESNDRGENPLHLLLKISAEKNDRDARTIDAITLDARRLLDANIDCAAILDKSENLYPFMLAAATFQHDKRRKVCLSLIFELLLKFVCYHELSDFSRRRRSSSSSAKVSPKKRKSFWNQNHICHTMESCTLL